MPNGKVDTVQVQDAVVTRQWTLSPGFKLLGQRLVEAADRTGAGSYPHQGLSHLSDFVGAHPTHKHLGQQEQSMPVLSSQKHLFGKAILYTTLGLFRTSRAQQLR